MDCKNVEQLVISKICQAIPEALQRQLDAHFQNCPACAAQWQTAQAQLSALEQLAPIAAPELSAQAIIKAAHRRALWLRTGAFCVVLLVFMAILYQAWLITIYRHERMLLSDLEKAIVIYRLQQGRYPQPGGNLWATLREVPQTAPYLQRLAARVDATGQFLDRWGSPIVYEWPGRHNPDLFDLRSPGRNLRDEQGKDDDLRNWSPWYK